MIVDMNYSGVYTYGRSWVRGTAVNAQQGGELNTDDKGTSQHAGVFQMLLPPEQASDEQVRGESVDEVVTHLETAAFRHTTVAGFMAFARANAWACPHDEETFFLWEASLTDLFASAPDPVIIQTDGWLGGPYYFYPNYKEMITELRLVSSIAQEHGVVFRWI